MSEFIQQKNIHYFPGHMAKALRAIEGQIKSADIVIEIADARAPISTRNPALSSLINSKPNILVLSKNDLSDMEITSSWSEFYAKKGLATFSADIKHSKILVLLNNASAPIVARKREKEAKVGMKKQPIKLLVLGIPNVGKSTFINNLAGKKVAKAENRPGVTRAEQWVKVSDDFILLDSPGILPMNYEDKSHAIKLAMLGSIKEDVLPLDELSSLLLAYLKSNYPKSLANRYGIEDISNLDDNDVFAKICLKRGYLLKGGENDYSKASLSLLKDFQAGEFGKISLERPSDVR